jgi:ABC-type branched-subunit amino acid transport system substrate-binding protein
MSSRLFYVPIFFSLLLLASCITLGSGSGSGVTGSTGGGTSSQNAAQTLTDADAAYKKGDFALATRLYNQYLSLSPNSPRREAILATAGLSAEKAKNFSKALESYGVLLQEFPNGGFAREALERIGQVYLANSQPQDALRIAQAQLKLLPKGQRQAYQKLVEAKALYMLGRYKEASQSFIASLNGADTQTRTDAQNGLYATFKNLSQDDLNNLARQYGQNFPGPEAVWFMAYQSAVAKDTQTLEAQSQYFKTYFPNHPWLNSLASLTGTAAPSVFPGNTFDPKSYVVTGTASDIGGTISTPDPSSIASGLVIVALLPLSNDNNSRYAFDALQGLKLALMQAGGKITVRELDSQGKPATVVRLIAEVAEDPKVIAIVGPIGSPETLAAAQTAQQLALPMIALSQRLGLTKDRSYIFRVFLTPEHQAKAVARYAILEQGHKNLGILYPDDAFGQGMLNYFQEEVIRLGASLVVQDSYNFSAGTFKEAVARITGGKSVRRASTSYQAPTNYTALYLPDNAQGVAQIVAEMAFHDVTKMQYLGSSIWYNKDLPVNAGRYLQGAVIPVPTSSLSQRPEAKNFVQAVQKQYGKDPRLFTYYGYDAGLAIVTALSSGTSSRQGLVRALLAQKYYPGATGPFSFDNEGEYSVDPLMLTINGTEFILLKDAGEVRFH